MIAKTNSLMSEPSPSVSVRKIGAIPGALIIGVRVANTTNVFCNRSVMSGAVMKGTKVISGDW